MGGDEETGMIPEIVERQADLAALCRRFRAARLEVFGSALRDDFDPSRSDIDLLVLFGGDAPRTFKHYFAFKEALEELLGRPVDLLEAGTVKNPYLLASIESSKQLLYAA